MPFKSQAQNSWAHTPAGMKALGGKKKVEEWEASTNYKNLPKRVVMSAIKKKLNKKVVNKK